jgi:NAD(P)-dependent dehydrogenase (short-subunit alcohol dehydrogenase family)
MDTPTSSTALLDLFSLRGRAAFVTGGSGALGSALCRGLALAGARVAIGGRRIEACEQVAEGIRAEGGVALALRCDVLELTSLHAAREAISGAFGPVDVLVNAAGGNAAGATTSVERPFFDLDSVAVTEVFNANFTGVFQACQVFGKEMAARGEGCIVNIASLSALRPLTRVGAYGAAKAAVANFTQWLATYLAQEYSPRIRVNAIAPGFFLTEQNRFLLTDTATGGWTARGEAILAHTPMRRLGAPEDLVGVLLWLASPSASFVTGVVVPVDGGFAGYSGV